MNKIYLLSLISILLLSGCMCTPTKDITVAAAADPKANFDGYKSYTWLGAAAALKDPNGQWTPPDFDAGSEIKFLIDRELRDRDISENSADPDLYIAFGLGVNMDALGVKVNPETKKETVLPVPQGALIIVLVDSETNFVIWSGLASADVLKNPTTETTKARLDYAVSKMFDELPN